jgi:myo-inositol-1(or 4)-monophosphatase
VVNPGSMSLALCAVASGRLDAGVGLQVDEYSTPASSLIMEEAGVLVTDLNGGPYSFNASSILAANPRLHAVIRAVVGTPGEASPRASAP